MKLFLHEQIKFYEEVSDGDSYLDFTLWFSLLDC